MSICYMDKIKERIEKADGDSVFILSDFSDIAKNATIRQCLNRLVLEGSITRVKSGIFAKQVYSKFLNEYIAIAPSLVAKAIARNYHWTIVPDGNVALNTLRLSTQVPTTWNFVSDGPYREYKIGRSVIKFKHTTNKEISGLSYISALVIQALKALGKKYVNDNVINILKNVIKDKEKKIMLVECKEATDWVYETIQEICRDNYEKSSQT